MVDNIKNEIKRKCQGCGKILNRNNLIKITLSNKKLHINPNSKILGRSMYVCPNEGCIKTIIKKKRVQAVLKFKNFDEISYIEKLLQKIVS